MSLHKGDQEVPGKEYGKLEEHEAKQDIALSREGKPECYKLFQPLICTCNQLSWVLNT